MGHGDEKGRAPETHGRISSPRFLDLKIMSYLSSILPKYLVKGISFTVTFPEPLLIVTLATARLRSPITYMKRCYVSCCFVTTVVS